MEFTEIAAAGPLARVVHSFWFLRGDPGTGSPQTIVPDGRVEIILHLAAPYALVRDDGSTEEQAESLVAGQLTGPMQVMPRAGGDVVGIKFRTAGAGALFAGPLDALRDGVVPLTDVDRGLAGALRTAAARSRSPDGRAAAMAAALTPRVRDAPDPRTQAAVEWLSRPSPPRIGLLADHLGLSERTLERCLLRDVGVGGRTLRRIVRFRRAFRALEGAPRRRGAELALALGYFDQAHLIREFRAFAGAPPASFLAGPEALAGRLLGGEYPAADVGNVQSSAHERR
jgi:AraC-like DNA-binding protein